MRGARKIVHYRGGEREETYIEAEKPCVKLAKPTDETTGRILRKRRDKVWLYLSLRVGLTPEQIAEVCRIAARSPRHIRRRIEACAEEVGADVPGDPFDG